MIFLPAKFFCQSNGLFHPKDLFAAFHDLASVSYTHLVILGLFCKDAVDDATQPITIAFFGWIEGTFLPFQDRK